MKQSNWRTALIIAVTSSALAAYASAQAQSTASDNKSGSSGQSQKQSANSNNQSSNSTNPNSNANNSQSNDARDSRDSNRSQEPSAQDQSRQDQNRPNTDNSQNADTNRRSSSDARDRNNASDRRDSATGDRDDRSGTRDRSNRDYDRNNDRNTDNRSTRSDRDRDSSRDRSSRRDNMRGPDIGIWFGRSSGNGLVISDVSSRGAIAKLGFHEGDRIVSVNGHRVSREDEFMNYLFHSDARRVKVIVYRDNREETVYVEPAVLVDNDEYADIDPLERFGIIVDDRYDDRIVVWRVIPRSPAYYAGFHPGDVIVTFAGHPYRTRTEFERGSRDWKAGDASVQIRRGERTRDLSVAIPGADRSARRTGERSVMSDERTAERDTTTSDQSTADRVDRSNANNQRNDSNNNNRGGVLNNLRGRGSR